MSKKKKKSSPRPKVPKQDWKHDIKVSQDYICPVCNQKGTEHTMDTHHCQNRCNNGKNTRENCVAVHKACHKLIHKKYGNEYFDPRTTKM